MEKKGIHYFYHEHELILSEKVVITEETTPDCYGCGYPISNSESAYVCAQQPHCSGGGGGGRIILHKRCGELPRKIFMHSSHPHHQLHLFDYRHAPAICDLCGDRFGEKLGYRCWSCDFDMHITCGEVGMDPVLKEKRELQHPSHLHPLTLMRMPPFSFICDACGVQSTDMAYICSTCEYWLHRECALLPAILPRNRHRHHHELSLTLFYACPVKFVCDVCEENVDLACWSYCCVDCRYIVHIHCIDVIQLPLSVRDVSKKLITPFVMRERGLVKIPDVNDTASLLLDHNMHPLSLINSEDKDEDEDEDEDKDKDDDDDAELKICDVCITPIFSPPYYGCVACKYFAHIICCMLPKTISTSYLHSPHLRGSCPSTSHTGHKFTLYATDGRMLHTCGLCHDMTNGMMYECGGCKMKIDVKCASLPVDTVRHTSHHHQQYLIMTKTLPPPPVDIIRTLIPAAGEAEPKPPKTFFSSWKYKVCVGCQDNIHDIVFSCKSNDCDFALDIKCALLPQSVTEPQWDSHHLLLTFDHHDHDRDRDHHFDDDICEICEKKMDRRKWKYHCRECDHSFHISCLKTASGHYTNIKFGRRFQLDDVHPHPLTFVSVTLKKRCDVCGFRVYKFGGFECASCNYVVCGDFLCRFKLLHY